MNDDDHNTVESNEKEVEADSNVVNGSPDESTVNGDGHNTVESNEKEFEADLNVVNGSPSSTSNEPESGAPESVQQNPDEAVVLPEEPSEASHVG